LSENTETLASFQEQISTLTKACTDQDEHMAKLFKELDEARAHGVFAANQACAQRDAAVERLELEIAQLKGQLSVSEAERVQHKRALEQEAITLASERQSLDQSSVLAKQEGAAKDQWRARYESETATAAALRDEVRALQSKVADLEHEARIVLRGHAALTANLREEHACALRDCRAELEEARLKDRAALEAQREAAVEHLTRKLDRAEVAHRAVVDDLSSSLGKLQSSCVGITYYSEAGSPAKSCGGSDGLFSPDKQSSSPNHGLSENNPMSPQQAPTPLTPSPFSPEQLPVLMSPRSAEQSTAGGVYALYQQALFACNKAQAELRASRKVVAEQKAKVDALTLDLDETRSSAAAAAKEAEDAATEQGRQLAVALSVAEEAQPSRTLVHDAAAAKYLAQDATQKLEARDAELAVARNEVAQGKQALRYAQTASDAKIAQLAMEVASLKANLETAENETNTWRTEAEGHRKKLTAVAVGDLMSDADAKRLNEELTALKTSQAAAEKKASAAVQDLETLRLAKSDLELSLESARQDLKDLREASLGQLALLRPPPSSPSTSLSPSPKKASAWEQGSNPKHGDQEAFVVADVARLEQAIAGHQRAAAFAAARHEEAMQAARIQQEQQAQAFRAQRCALEGDARAAHAACQAAVERCKGTELKLQHAEAELDATRATMARWDKPEEAVKYAEAQVLSTLEEVARLERCALEERHKHQALATKLAHVEASVEPLKRDKEMLDMQLRDSQADVASLDTQLTQREHELTVLKALQALRGPSAKKELSALSNMELGDNSSLPPSLPSEVVVATAHLAWSFLRVFGDESNASPKYVGPPDRLPPELHSGSRVVNASWGVCRGVLHSNHNLAAALERVTPAVLNQPKHVSAARALAELVKSRDVASVAAESMACGAVWAWAAGTIASAEVMRGDAH